MRKCGLCCRPVSVCLSVRLSVTLMHCIQAAEDIVKLLFRSGSPVTSFFFTQNADTQFQGESLHRPEGVKYTRGGKRFAIFDCCYVIVAI